MSDEWEEFEAAEVLRALGSVRTPAPRVLDAAREALWSAIAGEMLGSAPGGAPSSARTTKPRRVTERDSPARPRRQE